MVRQVSQPTFRHSVTHTPANWLHLFWGKKNEVVPLTWTGQVGQRIVLVITLLLGSVIWNEGRAVADFNGDGFADAVFGSGFGFSNNKVCLGDNGGNFTCRNVDDESTQGFGPAVGDMNNDGWPDVVFASLLPGFDRICLNAGVGVNGEWGGFNCNVALVDQATLDVALGYVDDDQYLDAVYASPRSEASRLTNIVALGDGAGGYKELIFLRDVTVDSRGVALGDVDHNGLVDAVFATSTADPTLPGENQVCLQMAPGTFQCNDMSSETNNSLDVGLEDLNGDDHLDAVFANYGSKNTVCLGDVSGVFDCGERFLRFVPIGDMSVGVALNHLNVDGSIDALFANFDEDGNVCAGDSAGTFICGPSQIGIQKSLTVAMEDMNSDGVPDVVFGNDEPPSRICLGLGSPIPPFFSECRDINTGLRHHYVALSPGTVTSDDSDGDSVSDNDDNCPQDANGDQEDADEDGAGDACDECPDDPNKIISGLCGCGVADTDSDGDGVADCQDLCELDPAKVEPGACGCGIPDTDSDSDGTPDCQDLCQQDPDKIDPGICGCGVADTDSDEDGVADCQDICPGFDDNQDVDGDGLPDGCDVCPHDPDNDADGDTICGEVDMCTNTVIPESVPTQRPGQNRFALMDDDTTFDTRSPKGNAARTTFTLQDTAGCSCEQIIAQKGLGKGHSKFGCSLGAMKEWTRSVNP